MAAGEGNSKNKPDRRQLQQLPDDGKAAVPALIPKPEPPEPDPNQPTLPLEEPIPARMINEFVYCPRLFYYEFVEGVFVHNADTLHGSSIHKRVDSGKGDLPPLDADDEEAAETIHSRSVSLGSDRLGVTAKLDLVEVRRDPDNLFSELTVCPVDYKAGGPREGEDGELTLWDADKAQLGLQILLLRDNGYSCDEGVIFYRKTRQRVRLPMTEELETWLTDTLAAARRCANGSIPVPLDDSPKCPRCSLVSVCLPDETGMLSRVAEADDVAKSEEGVRRLIAPRDEARAVYLNTPGSYVGVSGETLKISERDGKKRKDVAKIPLDDVSHVALFGGIQISTQAVQKLCEREAPVSYFSGGGWFYGLTRGHELTNVFTRMRQFEVAADEAKALKLSRAFVAGKIRNQRVMLMRNHVEPPAQALKRLRGATKNDCPAAAGRQSLLGIEGAAAALYFKHFDGMLKAKDDGEAENHEEGALSFDFQSRNRRPPRDPVNALLSLAYSLLAKDCTIAAAAVGFDPYVGFYHQPRYGRPALALDVMEEFRPLVADSAVLTAINNGMVGPGDFVRAGKAVNLSSGGRKKFFQAYERRVNALVNHPVFDYQVSYRRAIELQFRLLAKALTGEIPEYKPFTTR